MLNSSTGYQQIKKEVGELLQQNGFRTYKSSTYYQITSGDVLHFFTFQKGNQSLSDQMTINFSCQGLFSPGCSFERLQPSARLGNFGAGQKNQWHYCIDEKTTSVAIVDICVQLTTTIFPLLNDSFSSADQMINTFTDKQFSFFWEGMDVFIFQGYTYLKAKRYQEGLNIFNSNKPGSVPKFKTIQKHIESGQFDYIDTILQNNIDHHKNKLNIQ